MSSHSLVSNIKNKFHIQPESYSKKSKYYFGRTLGAGTYGIVREADGPTGKVAVKIILKRNVKGNEKMVYDELEMLQHLKHPHIVRFVDWFESRDKYYIVTQLATGGELFDRICEQGKFTEKDASQTIRQVLEAVDYLHDNNVVHRDLKPENLLYLCNSPDSDLVLADFGIAKMLDSNNELLTTMAGSFGYTAPEVMLKKGHGKPVDMWSLGVITYTLLCGYSPFRSENLLELIDECSSGKLIFHQRYWRDVSDDAKDFIKRLLHPDADERPTSKEALAHSWIAGENATDHNLLPEIKAFKAKSRLRRGIEIVKLTNHIEALKLQIDEKDDQDVPCNAKSAAFEAIAGGDDVSLSKLTPQTDRKNLTPAAKAAIFREIVLAKVREMKEVEKRIQVEKEAQENAARKKSMQENNQLE
ncbi:hypothetical protein Golomagni_00257 [Golovinomyces magnicellulatus]|nr:hypothetical protein Golomagni_00257 [Golovinomyces magnicellulatus]